MGMHTYVIGFRPADEKWKQMKEVWDACVRAGVGVPDNVVKFFGYDPPDDEGIKVDLEKAQGCTRYRKEMHEGFEIDLEELR